MHINPILNIEMKRHARSLKCCWVFFGINLLLGIIFLVSYFSIVGGKTYMNMGHYHYMVQSYVIMAYALFAALCLVLPGIAGAAITREREKNTLDMLLSTQLAPFKIVCGKLWVSLWLLCLILISALPMLSIIMALGVVSIFDLMKLALSLIFVGVFIGSISIFCSAMCRASNRAVLCSYAIVLICTVGTIALPRVMTFLLDFRMAELQSATYTDIGAWIYVLLLNPLVGFFGILSRQVGNGNEVLEICSLMGDYENDFVVNHLWECSIVLQMLLAVLLLYIAAKRLRLSKR